MAVGCSGYVLKDAGPGELQRALLSAGEVSDLMNHREEALKQYRAAIALDSSSNEADTARKRLNKPYQGH